MDDEKPLRDCLRSSLVAKYIEFSQASTGLGFCVGLSLKFMLLRLAFLERAAHEEESRQNTLTSPLEFLFSGRPVAKSEHLPGWLLPDEFPHDPVIRSSLTCRVGQVTSSGHELVLAIANIRGNSRARA